MNSLLVPNGPLAKYVGKTVLAIGAHPEDLELDVGGTLALLARCGARVVMCVVAVPNRLEARLAEAAAAAAVLGCELRVMIDDRCALVEDLKTYDLIARLEGLIARLEPALVLSHNGHNVHKDHVLVNEACMAIQRLHCFDLMTFFAGGGHPSPASSRPQAFVDIAQTIDQKMKAVALHASQLTCRAPSPEHCREAAKQYGRLAGLECAEGLEVVRLTLNSSAAPVAEVALNRG